jgi:hypothetical protein
MPAYTVHFEWHLLGHGLWCWACMLPSVYRLALVNSHTLRTAMTVEVCDDCGHRHRLR